MTDKELRTLDEMLTNLEIWSTWNKTFANEMIGICSKMRNLLADRKTEPQTENPINTRALDFVVELIDYIFEYPDDDYMTMECLCRKLVKQIDKVDGYYINPQEPTNDDKCFECDDFFTCGGQCNKIEDEPQTIRCPKCGRTDYIRDMEKDMGIKGSCYKYKCINCNTYIKDEPQTDCSWK